MTMSNKPCVPTNSCFLAIFTEIRQFVVEILRAKTEIYPFFDRNSSFISKIWNKNSNFQFWKWVYLVEMIMGWVTRKLGLSSSEFLVRETLTIVWKIRKVWLIIFECGFQYIPDYLMLQTKHLGCQATSIAWQIQETHLQVKVPVSGIPYPE